MRISDWSSDVCSSDLLVLVAHRRGAAFEVGDISALVGDDQSPLELPRILGINAEIGAELHRAAHAFGYIDEGAVGKDRAIERCEIIVVHRHDLAEPLLHQLGIFAEIGKEPCRESVCQSVKNWVVAVSLTKKN